MGLKEKVDPGRGNLASRTDRVITRSYGWASEVLLHPFKTILLIQARDKGQLDQVVVMKMGVSERI